ncbi:aminopeptidase P family protein [Pigmentiphaga sp. H8]|uniref:M24 family metallopeptidase n=1 Tax=unclassified Pigmentiphaga TaxID=2626614 RepID=UPI000F5A808E|nr:M24 family metallopeptidase [Pigmentiphaga sp. H8]AZG06621.1 aminopeptidase P family protein [Pigmentiphaga sp. H8]
MTPQDISLSAVSVHELERRWTLVREKMDELGLDALLVQNSNDWLGGYVRWFTGSPATNAYPRTLAFPRRGSMALIEQGPFDGDVRAETGGALAYGVGRILQTPSYASVHYTRHYDAELAVRALADMDCRRVGIVAPAAMYLGFGTHVAQLLHGVETVDATDLVDCIKAIKSDEEIGMIKATAVLQDCIVEALRDHLRPGLHDFEATAYAQYIGHLGRSEQGVFLGSSAPPGRAAVFRPRHQQGRAMKAGDVLTLLIENNGPGGMYTELARTFVLGKAPASLRRLNEEMSAAQRHTLELLRPGADPRDIFAAHNDYMRRHGHGQERRLHCHGQGYDMVERPLIRHDETMAIDCRMNIAIHPSSRNAAGFSTVCDNFLIAADGSVERLHRTPSGIIEIL